MFWAIKHILTNIKEYEIIKCLLTDHDGIKPEINNEKISEKTPRCTRLKKILLNNTWSMKKSKDI